MKKRISAGLVLGVALSLVLAGVVWATVGSLTLVSDTNTKVYYAGYEALPVGWNVPSFDDSAWGYGVLYQHPAYLVPTATPPFAGTGAAWISYATDQTTLPDYYDPSMVDGNPNFATYLFRKAFMVPATAYNVSGSVAVAADNYGWLYLNGDPAILGPKDPVWGYNFRPGDQNTGTVSGPSLACSNVLAARVENGAKVSGSGAHGPMGLLFLLDLDYEVPDVLWQPPVTNLDFMLKDGTTLPLKFKLYMQDGTLITAMQNVYLMVHGAGLGDGVAWYLGDGIDSLRWSGPDEYYYIANFQTRDYVLTEGDTYTAVVHDDCTDEILGTISFELWAKAGRGNSGK